jgi:spore maturation protein CgeB
MHIVLFCHSILSDWNHGNAHFLRGVVTELASRGHSVVVFEEEEAWSPTELVKDYGDGALLAVRQIYPALDVVRYRMANLDLARALQAADLVIVTEWSRHDLVQRIGRERARGGRFRLLFHDTHHRAVSAPAELARYDLSAFDGVLAFGEVLREIYVERGWGRRAFTWHEAADTRVFRPHPEVESEVDLVWIGNFGDEERTRELDEFLLEPVTTLGLAARAYGVRYPEHAIEAMARANIRYLGWLPNYLVPGAFARARVTVHVPRRPYSEALRGIPTIRPFEALACGIPLVSAPWSDDEGLFSPGRDFLLAANGDEMREALRTLLRDRAMARELAEHGLRTILRRHTCAHRVDELLEILRGLSAPAVGARGEHPAEAP